MTPTVRMPITVAARKGLSAVTAEAAEHRVLLTSHGRPVAVVDSAGRADDDVRQIREAARAVVECAADSVLQRRPAKLDLNAVCARLGIDPQVVRVRAAGHART